jgi:DNA invertase Pin-like site-specific DNA recombinase
MSAVPPAAILPRFIAYLRVSTREQGDSGLGLEAQREAVGRHAMREAGEIRGEFVEVESGKNNDRPELQKALARCRREGATLLASKLDRIGRKAAFVLKLIDDAGVRVACADQPGMTKLTTGILAVIAEDEARRISDRTREALAAAKARGMKLGGAREGHWHADPERDAAMKAGLDKGRIAGIATRQQNAAEAYQDIEADVIAAREAGKSLRAIAAGLNEQGHRTTRGKLWTATQVLFLLRRTGRE